MGIKRILHQVRQNVNWFSSFPLQECDTLCEGRATANVYPTWITVSSRPKVDEIERLFENRFCYSPKQQFSDINWLWSLAFRNWWRSDRCESTFRKGKNELFTFACLFGDVIVLSSAVEVKQLAGNREFLEARDTISSRKWCDRNLLTSSQLFY